MIRYFFLALLLPMILVAQPSTTKMGHSEIVDVKGATAATLTTRAKDFMTLKRIESKTVGNTISGTGTFTVSYQSVKKGTENGHVKFEIKLMVKDGKYKMDLTDFKHEGIQGKSTGGSLDLEKPECGETQITTAAWASIKEQAQAQLKAFVQELKTKMDHPAKKAPVNSDF